MWDMSQLNNKLALTSAISDGSSVDIDSSRTEAKEFVLFVCLNNTLCSPMILDSLYEQEEQLALLLASLISWDSFLHVRATRMFVMTSCLLKVRLVTLSIKKKKLHGLSPRANYTDRATATCRRNDCQLFADRGCHVVRVTDPYGRIFVFLNKSRYFSIK
jgi:hypothetical protein